jgi:sugar phosphate isomerase/epimerase
MVASTSPEKGVTSPRREALRLGLGSYALRWTLRETEPAKSCRLLVTATAELGLDLVQIADNVALLDLEVSERRALRAMADRAGVCIEVGLRSYRAGDFRKMLRIADTLGARHIRVVGVDLLRLEELLRRVRADTEAWGGQVVVENYFPVPTSELLEVLGRAGGFVGTCADTANSIPAGEWPLETLRGLLPLARYVHIKDYQFVPAADAIGWTLIGAPLGTGCQKVEAIVRAAAEAPHSPDFILEHWLPWMGSQRATSRTEREWLEHGVSVLRPLLAAPLSVEPDPAYHLDK